MIVRIRIHKINKILKVILFMFKISKSLRYKNVRFGNCVNDEGMDLICNLSVARKGMRGKDFERFSKNVYRYANDVFCDKYSTKPNPLNWCSGVTHSNSMDYFKIGAIDENSIYQVERFSCHLRLENRFLRVDSNFIVHVGCEDIYNEFCDFTDEVEDFHEKHLGVKVERKWRYKWIRDKFCDELPMRYERAQRVQGGDSRPEWLRDVIVNKV